MSCHASRKGHCLSAVSGSYVEVLLDVVNMFPLSLSLKHCISLLSRPGPVTAGVIPSFSGTRYLRELHGTQNVDDCSFTKPRILLFCSLKHGKVSCKFQLMVLELNTGFSEGQTLHGNL